MGKTTARGEEDPEHGRQHGAPSVSRTIKALGFKATCLRLMDEVAENRGGIVITNSGRPTARLVVYREKPRNLFGIEWGKLEILGDFTAPLDVEWEADPDADGVLKP